MPCSKWVGEPQALDSINISVHKVRKLELPGRKCLASTLCLGRSLLDTSAGLRSSFVRNKWKKESGKQIFTALKAPVFNKNLQVYASC